MFFYEACFLGDISFELSCVRGIPATLIEPRYRKPSKQQKQKMDQINKCIKQISTACMFHRIRAKMTHDGSLRDVEDANPEVDLANVCRNSSLIVGMHPDQATEAIVRAAVMMRKPFAVVPCCVFAREFPERSLRDSQGFFICFSFFHFFLFDRRTPDGRRVTSFKDFIEFLASIAGFKFSDARGLGTEQHVETLSKIEAGDGKSHGAELHQQSIPEDTSNLLAWTFEPSEATYQHAEKKYVDLYELRLRQLGFAGKNVVLFSKSLQRDRRDGPNI